MRYNYYIMCGVLALTACTSNLKKENEALRSEIEAKRTELDTKLEQQLRDARNELATTDSLRTLTLHAHDEQHDWVMAHATELTDQSAEVLRLNELRAQLDSLNVAFEQQAHKVKFYMKKMEEWEQKKR